MEDDEEVVNTVDASPPSPVKVDVTEQCDTVLVAGDSSAKNDGDSPARSLGEGCEKLGEESEEKEKDERENEGLNVEELESKENEKEELPPVSEELEVKNEREVEVDVDEIEKVEELPPVVVVEELEVKGEERESPARSEHDVEAEGDEVVKGEEERESPARLEEEVQAEGDEVAKAEEVEVEGDEVAKAEEVIPVSEKEELVETEELEGEKVEKDDEEMVEEKHEEEELKGREEEEGGEKEGEGEGEEMEGLRENGGEMSPIATKEEEVMEEEETPTAEEMVEEEETETPIVDTEMETEKSGSGSGGKRKRGRNAKATPVKAPTRKTVGEDVCFICLDGGDLVLCDRRACPKAYHPSCVDHDDEFFKTKGRWNCGWHLCNKCGKNAYFMCYTCTFSLCKGCCKDAVVFCVRGNKGFCESCMKTVMMIENSEQNEMGQVPFDDKSSWEYLFKDYWIEQKRKLCITADELSHARNPFKGSDADKQQTSIEVHEGNDDVGTDSDNSLGNLEVSDSKRKKAKKKSRSVDSDTDSFSEKDVGTPKRKARRKTKSQTKEAHSDSEHSSGHQDTNNKRGKRPRRLTKSNSKNRNSSSSAATNERMSGEGSVEWASPELLEFVMHMKDGDKSVLTQFDVQGLLLEYIKRNKLRDPRRQSQIICDLMLQKLFGKPRVGHFEMLKLLESHFLAKEDFQVDDNHGSVADETNQFDADDNTDSLLDAGRSKGRKSRRRGEGRGFQSNLDDYAAVDMHNINLIYLRRNLMEPLMDDSETFHDKVVGTFVRIRISGSSQKQDIYRLVQIIGTSKAAEPYRVGKRTTDVMLEILNLDKTETVAIDTISNQDFTEDECKRLRQSIKCGLISRMTVGDVVEKARELQEVRVIDWLEAEIVRLSHLRDRASEKGRKKELRECVEKLQLLKTPEERQRRLEEIPEVHADPKMDPSCVSEDENEMDNKRRASNMRPRDSGFFRRGKEHFSSRKAGTSSNDSWSANARPPNKSWELNRNLSGKGTSSRREDIALASQPSEQTWSNGVDKGTPLSNSWEKPRLTSDPSSIRADMSTVTASESSQPVSAGVAHTDAKVDEAEKIWHYRDPTGKVQGPFSMTQLRKWSNTGYFPADLKIWKSSRSEDDSTLLTEALAGRLQKESPSIGVQSDIVSKIGNAPSQGRYDSSNLPSPTPSRSKWSTASSVQSTNQFQGSNERLPSPTPTSPSSNPSVVDRSNFSRQYKDSSLVGSKEANVASSVGLVQSAIGQGFSTPGLRLDVSHNSGTMNAQQILSQSAVHVANQAFASSDARMSQTNLVPDAKTAAQGFSNMAQPGSGQNPSVYNQNWTSGYVARPDVVNANLAPSNQNALPPQLPYGQWAGAPVNNQASAYGAGYPAGPGNIAPNMPAMPTHNAWGPAPTNMAWGGQQQQPVNPNTGWAAPAQAAAAAAAFGQAGTVNAAMGQLVGPTPGAAAMPSMNAAVGWTGAAPNSSAGNTNPGWVAQTGNTGGWGGDQNHRNGGGAQWNRQSSFGSGGAAPSGPGTPRGHRGVCKFHENGHCRKGTSCDFMHT